MNKLFDLNIEQVLENWESEHALREIIANALDEQILSQSENIKIYNENDCWHIRDFGRGLQYTHFTQNENQEKLNSPNLIGKFGVGLKDALAVFHRKGINVEIDSKYAHIELEMANKTGFDIKTLHASFNEPKDHNMIGTDFIIKGVTKEAVDKAKSMFLYFNNATLLEKTRYGEVYKNNDSAPAKIYINGVQVALEDNFLFSYNITNINAQIKKALNRERTNVGRSAYSDTIKNILKQCTSYHVLIKLVEDLQNIMNGTNHDESTWSDIAAYAATSLNESGDVVFMTPTQRNNLTNSQLEILQKSKKKLIMVTENVFSKVKGTVTTYNEVLQEYNSSFKYEFINYDNLTPNEKNVFDNKDFVIDILKKYNYKCNAEIKISETIQLDQNGQETLGLCKCDEKTIIIKRKALSSIKNFLKVLLHEFAHYHSGYEDNTRDFENVLTDIIGILSYEYILNTQSNKKEQKIK